MSDDLSKKIKQITDILGQENMPDNIKGLLSLLANSGSQTKNEASESNDALSVKDEKASKSELEDNLEMIRKVKKVVDRLNSKDDPRINLLNAIRPFLNNTRQKKINNCIKLLHIHNLTKYIDEHDKNFF